MLKTIFFIIIGLSPFIVLAQDASNIMPHRKVLKDTTEQLDLIDIAKTLFKINPKKIPKQRKAYFSLLPLSSAPNGAGQAIITSMTAGVYLGPRNTTNLSSAAFAPYWNLGKRFGLPLRTSIWLTNNDYNIQGDIRFLIYPQYTWGLGSKNAGNNDILVDYDYIRFYQTVLKQIKPYFFAGVGYNLDYHFDIKSNEPDTTLKQFTNYQYGTGTNSFSSGLTLNLLYDCRNNSVNPLPGTYANIIYRINPTFLGSNNYWNSLYVDVRKYISLNKANPDQQNTLAFWSYIWTVFNNNVPYLDLPSIDWDSYNRSGRGIDQNRYRGKTLFYFESEYRRDITENGLLGFVIFSNVNTVSGSGTLFTSWNPAAGAGLRVKFNKGSNTNLCIDYGFSKDYNAIILNLGETF